MEVRALSEFGKVTLGEGEPENKQENTIDEAELEHRTEGTRTAWWVRDPVSFLIWPNRLIILFGKYVKIAGLECFVF